MLKVAVNGTSTLLQFPILLVCSCSSEFLNEIRILYVV